MAWCVLFILGVSIPVAWIKHKRCHCTWRSSYSSWAFFQRFPLPPAVAAPVFQSQIMFSPVTWCGLSITSLSRAAYFPVNWSCSASVWTTFHCTKRVNWTTQPRNTFLVTWWNRTEHFTWVWWFAVITLVRACAVRTVELVFSVLASSASVWKDSVDFIAKVWIFFLLLNSCDQKTCLEA